MGEIQKVVILGAGALGASYATSFFETDEFSTSFVARDQRYTRLKNHGVVVNGKPYAIPVIHPDDTTTPADLIIVALKHHHLSQAVNDLSNIVGNDTTIISVMNGLDSENYIGSVYGIDKLLFAISVGIDAVRQENRISFVNQGKIFFGEADNTHLSQRVQRIQRAFDLAGINYETPTDMIRMMWWKFMVNVGMNQASAVMQAPYGVFQSSPDAQAVMEALMREVIVLAKSAGVNLEEKDLDDWYTFLNTLAPQGKTSMLQDIEVGRKTEVEIFGGKVVELGKTLNIPTPVNQTLLGIIHVLEEYTNRTHHFDSALKY